MIMYNIKKLLLSAAAVILCVGCAEEPAKQPTPPKPTAAAAKPTEMPEHKVPEHLATVENNVTTLLNTNSCPNCDLRGAHLPNADLVGADLSGANLEGAHLVEANLHGANLSGANLSGANLPMANLTNANLTGAKLEHVHVYEADFSGVRGISHETKILLAALGAKVD